MKILKRVLSGMLCAAVLCCSVQVLAEEDEKIYGEAASELLQVLEIGDYSERDLKAETTRGEFFRLAAIAGGYGDSGYTRGRFTDVGEKNEYVGYAESLVNAGIISANKLGQICLENTITLREAAAVMIKILGYGMTAEIKGGYPAGYSRLAANLSLLDGMKEVEADTVLTEGMAAQLIYNALDTETMTRTGYGSSFGMVKGERLAYAVFGVYHITAVVNGVDITRLMGENDVDAFYAEIGGIKLETRAIENIYDYLGYRVEAFYEKDKGETLGKLIYLSKCSDNKETIIDIEDIEAIDSRNVKYYDSEGKRTKTASFAGGAPVIYNGTATGQVFSKSMIEGKTGEIRLLDNGTTGAAAVVFVDVYKNYAAAHVDANKYELYNMYDSTDKIVLDTKTDDPYTVIYDADGKECSISKIKRKQIVSIYQSASDAYQQYIRAYLCDVSAEGAVTKTSDGGRKIYIDNTEYTVNAECMTKYGNLMTPGSFIKVYTDIKGRIAMAERGSTDDMAYAYIVNAKMLGKIDKEVNVRIFTQNGDFEDHVLAKKVYIDGVSRESKDSAVMTHLHNACAAQFGSAVDSDKYSSVIRYKTNDSGEISVIDTILNGESGVKTVREDKNTARDVLFTVESSSSKDYYRSTNNTLGPNIALDTNAQIMVYPSPIGQNLFDETLYLCAPAKSVLVHEKRYSANAFYTNRGSVFTDFIGLASSSDMYSTLPDANRFAVVKEVRNGLDENGDSVKLLAVLGNNGESEVTARTDFTFTAVDSPQDPNITATMGVDDLHEGDLIRYCIDVKGYLAYVDLYYRSETGTNVKSWATSYRTGAGLRRGYIYDMFDDGYYVYFTDSRDKNVMSGITYADCELVLSSRSSAVYYTYNASARQGQVVKGAKPTSLRSYNDTGMNCSEIIIQQNYGTAMAVLCIE